MVAYNGYTQSAKRAATLQNYKMASKFIDHTFALCGIQSGSIKISAGNINDCDAINNQTNVIKMAETFRSHFLKMGFKIHMITMQTQLLEQVVVVILSMAG